MTLHLNFCPHHRVLTTNSWFPPTATQLIPFPLTPSPLVTNTLYLHVGLAWSFEIFSVQISALNPQNRNAV